MLKREIVLAMLSGSQLLVQHRQFDSAITLLESLKTRMNEEGLDDLASADAISKDKMESFIEQVIAELREDSPGNAWSLLAELQKKIERQGMSPYMACHALERQGVFA